LSTLATLAAASLAHAWNTRNCTNLLRCAGRSVEQNASNSAAFAASPSASRSMRASTCAIASSIIESSVSAVSSTGAARGAASFSPLVAGLCRCPRARPRPRL
jgi:hypothetical protein